MPSNSELDNKTIENNNYNCSPIVSILHFNDCYNIEPRSQEPSGGAARFVTALRSFTQSDPIVLFSGDVIAPSISLFQTFTSIQIYLKFFFL
jgi:hypothetical protein